MSVRVSVAMYARAAGEYLNPGIPADRQTLATGVREIERWYGATPLLIGFFSGSDVAVYDGDDGIVLSVDGIERELTRREAVDLRSAVGDALRGRREFVHTAGEHRADGTYVVHRRGAESAGNHTVFDGVADLRALYERLPREFDAEAVGREGITGSRRHLVVRHFAEHPRFDCELASRCPLQVRKSDPGPDAVAASTAERG